MHLTPIDQVTHLGEDMNDFRLCRAVREHKNRHTVRRLTGFAVALVLTMLVAPRSTDAAFPGANGKIAFTSDRDGDYEIYTMNPDGSAVVKLTDNSAFDYAPSWSPDGSKIAFFSTRDGNPEIYVMDHDGANQANKTNHPNVDADPAWSPDGTKIVFNTYRDGNGEIYTMDSSGANQSNRSNSPAQDAFPDWAPIGDKIAFVRGSGPSTVWTMNADGSSQAQLSPSDGRFASRPDWSPDSAKIAYGGGFGYGATADIFSINIDGTNRINLTPGAPADDTDPAWSPDGTKIAFFSSGGISPGNAEIYVMNADGGSATRATDNPAADVKPDWQPLIYVDDVAPTTTIAVEPPADGDNNWHLSDATIALSAVDNDGGSGVAGTEYSFDNGNTWQSYSAPFGIGTEGTTTILAKSTDNAGNIEEAKSVYVKIDMNPPDIAIATPVDGVEYLLGQTVISDWTVSDPVSGITDTTATTPSGQALDTSAVGPHLFTVAARDNAGNESSTTLAYNVRYAFCGFQRPIDPDGESIFEAGRTVPVKFRLEDAAGRYVSGATARIYLAKIVDGVVGDEIEGVSVGKRTTGNLFRFDRGDNRYIFNLSTRGLSPGIWRIRVALDDGSSQSAIIRLRKHSRVEESESEYHCR